MPYIKQEDREGLDGVIETLMCHLSFNDFGAGDINYMINKLFSRILEKKGMSYAKINELIGALECAKLELYRKVAVPYERNKCIMNGEVFPEQEIIHDKTNKL